MDNQNREEMQQLHVIRKTDKFVSASGGSIDYVSKDGEILRSVAVPAGIVSVRKYLEICPEGAELQIADGIEVIETPNGYHRQGYGVAAFETAANPHYQPSSADAMARQLDRLTRQVAVLSRAPERSAAARQSLVRERIPQAGNVEDAEQIEAGPEVMPE